MIPNEGEDRTPLTILWTVGLTFDFPDQTVSVECRQCGIKIKKQTIESVLDLVHVGQEALEKAASLEIAGAKL